MSVSNTKLQKHLKKLCHLWQKILKLEDWRVTLEICRHYVFEEDRLAEISVNQESKTAHIRVLDPADYDQEEWILPDSIESLVVHELLHIHFNPLSDYEKDSKRIAEEQAVHALTTALVSLANR